MQLKNSKTVILDEEHLLAKGGERFCYIHPEDSQKVIKAYKNNSNNNRQNDLEYLYYNYLTKRKCNLRYISKCYGYIHTNYGKGVVFQRALNFDGSPSRSLQYMMLKKEITVETQNMLINQLIDYLKTEQILFVDTCLSNVFCIKKKNEKYELMIVDGLGAKRLNYKYWSYIYIGFYRRYKINKQAKKLKRFHQEDLLKIKNGKERFSRM
jgi:hypothetical protein